MQTIILRNDIFDSSPCANITGTAYQDPSVKLHNQKQTNLTGSKVLAVYSRSKSRNNYIFVWHTEEIIERLMLSSDYDNNIGSYYVMRWKVAFCHTCARQFPCEVYLLLHWRGIAENIEKKFHNHFIKILVLLVFWLMLKP